MSLQTYLHDQLRRITMAGYTGSIATPKVSPGQAGYGSYAKTTTPSPSILAKVDRRPFDTDLMTLRSQQNTKAVLRLYSQVSPDLSGALFAYLRVAITQGYKVKARNAQTGEFDEESTRIAYQILGRMNTLPDYVTYGFSPTPSIRSVAEALGKEIILTGACAMELVLDKGRMPERLAPISTTQIFFYEEGKGLRPVQRVGGTEIDLDIATFFYVSLDQDLLTTDSASPLEASVQPTLADTSFTNDLRRALRRVILPRLNTSIDYEKLLKLLPPSIRNDADKLYAEINKLKTDVEGKINTLNPEDALVGFDATTHSYINGGTGEATALITAVQDILNSKVATGAKTLPSVLGHGNGSQTTASSETLLFIKSADGAIRVKLNEMFSKALTLGVRLAGKDVIVDFEYDPIDLRPETELAAFRAQKQSLVLEQLSLGLISTAEASIELTGKLPRAGYQELAGTFFAAKKPDPNGNMYSGTSTGGSGQTAVGQDTKSTAPTNVRAGNTK
jgi:hypothetical protein